MSSNNVVCAFYAVLLSLISPVASMGTPDARDTDFSSRVFTAAQTAKRQCVNTCRARYRDCVATKQIPNSECRGVYQDCTRFTCNAVQG
jgi:hypothetical protein